MSMKQIGPRLWELRVQWRDPKTGGKRSLQERFEGTERAAGSRLAALRRDAKAIGARPERQKLEAFARSWMASRVARGIKPSALARYASALDTHILPALGDYWMDRIERDDVQAYVNARTLDGAKGHTVMNELRLLRAMARDAAADGASPKNWCDRVIPPAVSRWTEDRPNLLSAPQLAAVLASVERAWLPMVTLAAFTGLRWGELSALRWGDVDTEAGSIRIRRSNWRGELQTPKTDASVRSVPLPAPVAAMLEASGRGKDGDLLFPNRQGKLHKGWPLVKVMQRACADAGVQYTTPHGLRRTFNNLARQVAAAQVVKSITGHTTDKMLEHYSMVGLDEKAEATRLVLQLVAATSSNEVQDENGAGAERGEGEES